MPIRRLTPALAAVLAVAAVAALSPASHAAHAPVAVFPAQGNRVASPQTQISFRGATPAELQASHIVIRGSVSGVHSGTLKAHSDGNGASFIPDSAFHTGEHVRVISDLPLVREQNGYVRFQVYHSPGNFSLPTQHDEGGNPPGAQHFVTRPDLQPPSVIVTKHAAAANGEGDVFVGAKAGPGEDGTMIVDENGHLLWFKRAPLHRTTFDFRTQNLNGKPVLTWWQGKARPGQGLGAGQIYDTRYHKIGEVRPGDGYEADLHEFEITPRSTALVLAYVPVDFGGEVCMDESVQEIDVPTGLVLFEWDSLGQISSKESFAPHNKGQPFDLAHVNSLQMEPSGNILISARHTNAVYELNHQTAQINWRLGGNRSDFDLSNQSQFIGQHDARLQADGSITMYDNGGPTGTERESRALWLNVDAVHHRVTVRHSYHYSHVIDAYSQGGMQLMSDGHVFVGWGGNQPNFTEFTPGGTMIWDGHFYPSGDDTYRAYRLPWKGNPDSKPAIAAIASNGNTRVYASWNGATEVRKWQVLTGPNPALLTPAKTKPWQNFETSVLLASTPAYVAVRAIGPSGETLGQSVAVQPSSG